MADNNCSDIINSLLGGMDQILANKTVMGDPMRVDDCIILPLSDVSFGVGAGASLNKTDKNSGGGGMFGKLTPNAVLIIRNGSTRLVNIKNQDTVNKIFDMIPDVFDRISEISDKKGMPSRKAARDIAFPDK